MKLTLGYIFKKLAMVKILLAPAIMGVRLQTMMHGVHLVIHFEECSLHVNVNCEFSFYGTVKICFTFLECNWRACYSTYFSLHFCEQVFYIFSLSHGNPLIIIGKKKKKVQSMSLLFTLDNSIAITTFLMFFIVGCLNQHCLQVHQLVVLVIS